jgi:hypothetical protein
MQGFVDTIERPNYHYGDFITGSAVRGDAPLVFERVRKAVSDFALSYCSSNRGQVGRKAVGLDMEASAFLQLCQSRYFNHKDNEIHCLGVLKGISDFGDERKDQDQEEEGGYKKALINTAKAISEWIPYHIPAVIWKPRYGKITQALLRESNLDQMRSRQHHYLVAIMKILSRGFSQQWNSTSTLPQRMMTSSMYVASFDIVPTAL